MSEEEFENFIKKHGVEIVKPVAGVEGGGVLELNPRFGGGFPFSYEAGVNFPKALIQMINDESFYPQLLVPDYDRMFSKNDYLMEIK